MRRVLVVVWVLQMCVLLMRADSSSAKDHTTKDRTTTATPSSQLYQDLPESLQNNLLLQAPAEQNAPINPKTKYIQLANNLPIYILPAYYSFSPPYSRNDIPVEMKFQVSFRVVFLEQLVCKYCNFDFAYTQTHWFQIYNAKDSKPMRDINFSPSFMFNYTKQLAFLGGYITTMRLGYIHLSNGERKDNLVVGEADIRNDGLSKDDPGWLRRSKSIDRFIAQIDWQRGRFGLSLRAWVPVGKHLISDMGDNDNLTSYIGFGDMALSYEYKRHLFELYVNNIFNNYFSKEYWDWKGRLELGYTYRLSKRVGIYFQVIHGFGDSLYEFNYSLTRAGSGLRLNF
ncbi:phospholipase A [Helicobacter zhangjianzhongii]|uniref:Phospholipase A n=1 Tax=Helicobacter zhangjianzhongii TaxID=2974574 RepID=A0ACC6FRP0_9HELI|nr:MULTISPECIES: phospholipase A [unclassified Helicobacter]MDL0080013.1 phospholipase A [Helicobacter sp. CPD2-1]MDL0081800.1 phospholipase A [Helicobacter sp. XJK30-2]